MGRGRKTARRNSGRAPQILLLNSLFDPPNLMILTNTAFDEDGHDTRNNDTGRAPSASASLASVDQAANNGGGAAASSGNKQLAPMPGQLGAETGAPASEAMAAAAGASPDMVVAVARGDASSAAK
jgi:hypothetical protein